MNDRLATKRRWSRRKEARPEEITAAALDLFVERGFANTRLEDVAARAGISKGTLYLYFANKEELFKAVLREALIARMTEFKDIIETYEGSTFDLVRMLVLGWWDRIGSRPISGIPKLILAEARNFPEIARFYLDEVVQPGRAMLAAVLRRGMDRGEFRQLDPDAVGHLLMAPMLMIALWRNSLEACCQDARIDALGMLEAHIDMLNRGLAAEGKTP